MKTNLANSVALAAALTFTFANAQTVDTTTGQEIGTLRPPPKLVALLVGNSEFSKVHGILRFTGDDQTMGVNGRIEGLEPGRRYQLMIRPLTADTVITTTSGVTQKAPDGSPAAGPPQVANPNAGLPDAGSPQAPPPQAGLPDGQDRPGAPGSGTQGTPTSGNASPSPAEKVVVKPAVIVGINILTADSTGATNFQSATLPNMDFSGGPNGIKGRTVSLHLLPKTDQEVTQEVALAIVALPVEKAPEP